MRSLKITVNNIWLEPAWAVAGTRGSFGSCRMEFVFSPEWQSLNKRVTFFPAGGGRAVEKYLSCDRISVPNEIMLHPGSAAFVIDGVSVSGEKLISQKGELRIIDTATPGGALPIEPDSETIKHLKSEITCLRATVRSLREEIHGIKVL